MWGTPSLTLQPWRVPSISTLRLLRSLQRPRWAASDKEEEMKTYIPTIEELQDMAKSELSVKFRKAAELACDPHRDPTERAAARKTVENIRRCRARLPSP